MMHSNELRAPASNLAARSSYSAMARTIRAVRYSLTSAEPQVNPPPKASSSSI